MPDRTGEIGRLLSLFFLKRHDLTCEGPEYGLTYSGHIHTSHDVGLVAAWKPYRGKQHSIVNLDPIALLQHQCTETRGTTEENCGRSEEGATVEVYYTQAGIVATREEGQ